MARGWESKAVESQQADRASETRKGPLLSPEAQVRRDRATSVALALADATAQLQAACHPAHKDALRQRVTALRTLLGELQATPEGANR